MFFCLVVIIPCAMGQSKPVPSQQLTGFINLLSNINATFLYPEDFKELKLLNNEKLPFQYGLKLPDADFEIWFQVNSVKADWQRYENDAVKQLTNPDSLYIKTATDEAKILGGTSDYLIRILSQSMLDRYNADEGRSYLITLMDLPTTKHYQYALLIVLHKNGYGNIIAVCLGNDKGPAFFKNISKLKDCFKFNN
jgi:WD40 repeat protein